VQSQVCIAVAHETGQEVQVIVAGEDIQASKDFKQKNATAELPFLESSDCNISEATAIVKHFARKSQKLLGSTPLQRAQVE